MLILHMFGLGQVTLRQAEIIAAISPRLSSTTADEPQPHSSPPLFGDLRPGKKEVVAGARLTG